MDIMTILQIIIGFIGSVAIAVPFSDNFKIINYKYVFYGILSQIILAAILLKVPFVISGLIYLMMVFLYCYRGGAKFVFGYNPQLNHPF